MSFLITSVLNCASDRLAISSSLSCIFSGALKCYFIWAIFFLSWCTCQVKGQSLRCSPGRGNSHHCLVTLYVGEGPRGNSAACSALSPLSVTSPTTHKQIWHFWCWFPGAWFCVHSRTLWVSPMNSPVSLGVSPATSTTATGFYCQRF